MRIMLAAGATATAGLIAAGVLGVATAETPTATPMPPPRTVSVQGVATEPIDQSASAATATAVYRQGMADAVTDGQAKAQFLAGKASATLGAVQSMIEGGGYIGCAANNEYLGEQPDFGSPAIAISGAGVSAKGAVPRSSTAPSRPVLRRHHPRHRRAPRAKHAVASTCTLSTQVSLVYLLS